MRVRLAAAAAVSLRLRFKLHPACHGLDLRNPTLLFSLFAGSLEVTLDS